MPTIRDVGRILFCLILVKISYLILLAGLLYASPDFSEKRFRGATAGFLEAAGFPGSETNLMSNFARHFATWDAAHYLFLSKVGYSEGVKSCAFYPMWPILIRWFSVATGVNHLITGMVLANIFSLAGWCLFYVLTAGRFGERQARWALVLLLVFPGSLFYQFIYSESLFFLVLMLLWFGLERGSHSVTCISALFLPLIRGAGVFTLLPIAWLCFAKSPWGERWFLRSRDGGQQENGDTIVRQRAKGCSQRCILAILSPLIGIGAYFALMWKWTGNPFEGVEAQKYWGVHSIANLWNLPKFIIGFFEPTTWHEFKGSVLDRCAFILICYCIPLIWRLGKDMIIWTYALGVLPAMSGTFVSFIRFESVVFPLFIALSLFLTSRQKKWPLVIFVMICATLHAILLWRFVNFRWAG